MIGSYVDGVRSAAKQAVERALVRSAAGRPTRGGKRAFSRPPASASRRTAAELTEVCDALCEVVRAHPGGSMVALAEKMGSEARTLPRPMARLKSTGRVRSVGQRHLTRVGSWVRVIQVKVPGDTGGDMGDEEAKALPSVRSCSSQRGHTARRLRCRAAPSSGGRAI